MVSGEPEKEKDKVERIVISASRSRLRKLGSRQKKLGGKAVVKKKKEKSYESALRAAIPDDIMKYLMKTGKRGC